MNIIFLLILIAIVSYVVAGVNGSIITSKLVYHKDVRNYGSRNPGLTNYYRTFGKNTVIIVILVDILKALIPVLVSGYVVEMAGEWSTAEDRVFFGRLFAGFFAMLGHCYPVFYKFKGGKGVLTGGTVTIMLDWRIALMVWGVFIITVALTRYVSLGSVLAGIGYPVGFFMAGYRDYWVLAVLSGGLVVWRHRDNIKRLLKGEERKFSFKRNPSDMP